MRWSLSLTLMIAACSPSNSGGGPGDGSGSGSSSVNELVFAVVGDTRPPSPDDTANYPSAIITKIYQDIATENSNPVFAVGTGDYMFASTSGSEQVPQLDKYMSARGNFSGPFYPAMGNHECTGATDSNCGQGNRDGVTTNMTEFIHMMLEPNGVNSPYYVENIKANDGSWTAKLVFAVAGDTRPASIDDTTNYPTAIITKIYQDIEAETSHPAFVVATGDYQFTSTRGSEQIPQLDKYMTARAGFTGPLYPAMGNHECTGATDSNCGSGATDGITANMSDFISTMLMPNGISSPYYVENVAAKDNSWTAKFVFVACNAWNSTQASWLTNELAQKTTYTFVVRHESAADVSQTPCSQSQTIINANPLTLLIVGHTHEYRHESYDKEIIVGNGGAPLTSGTNYGYVIISRQSSGNLLITAYDYMSHATLDSFQITASGSGA